MAKPELMLISGRLYERVTRQFLGAEGPAGPTGPPGIQGPQGNAGTAGQAGSAGPQGLQGPAGPQGEIGPQGPIGNTGPAGTGTQGIQGIPGIPGTPGVAGTPGLGFVATCKKTADQNMTATALADVADMTLAMAASTDYFFEFFVRFRSAATTTGANFSVAGPASPADTPAWLSEITLTGAASTDGIQSKAQVAADATHITASIDAANADRMARLSGVWRNGVNAGNLQLRAATEVLNSAITVRRGSFGRLS